MLHRKKLHKLWFWTVEQNQLETKTDQHTYDSPYQTTQDCITRYGFSQNSILAIQNDSKQSPKITTNNEKYNI